MDSWQENPGIDEDTQEGRVFSIRYRYNAHWYITSLINEVRVCNTTDENGIRKPARMPYHAMIQREYVYHNTVGGDEEKKKTETDRIVKKPEFPLDSNKNQVKVNINTLE